MNALPALEKEEKPFLVEKAPRPDVSAASAYIPPRQMFSDSLLELSSTDRRRRKGTALFSFILQGLIVGVLILLPLWFTDVLPAQQLVTFLVAPPPPPPPAPPAPPMKAVKMVSQIVIIGRRASLRAMPSWSNRWRSRLTILPFFLPVSRQTGQRCLPFNSRSQRAHRNRPQ